MNDQLSFHVDSADSMRCYLYINGQHSRFFPPDIKMVLPQFLVANDLNDKFLESDEIDEMILGLEDKLIGMIFPFRLDLVLCFKCNVSI